MNISPLIKQFIPLLNKTTKRENNNYSIKYDLIMISLYKNILEANNYVNNCVIHSKTTLVHKLPQELSNNNRFFPKPIRKYIQDTTSSLFNFNCILEGREININFYCFDGKHDSELPHIKLHKLMLTWLYVCNKYSNKKCSKTMTINIFLTPFTKTLPCNKSTVLSADHVNTAFTMCCVPDGEITIYREEEWFKVFIHETFHAYGLDFGLNDSDVLRKTLKTIFPIKSEFNPCEAYTETWARIINCALYSFSNMHGYEYRKIDKASEETFLLYVNFCLELERLFAIYQMNKLLRFMGLNYKDLYDSRENSAYLRQQLYKEDTHVFAYYILTAIFLNDYKQFIQLCSDINTIETNTIDLINENSHVMKFKCTEQSFSKMSAYISNVYNNKDLLKTVEMMQKTKLNDKNKLNNTTRMAIIDINNL